MRIIPDYTENYLASKRMAEKIEGYYHDRGHQKVKVWLEKSMSDSGKTHWYIRSNIVFTCDNI